VDDCRVQAANPLKQVANLFVFKTNLSRVIQVLILAAPALTEIMAARLNSLRRWLNYPQQFCTAKVLFDFCDLRLDDLAYGYPRDEKDKIMLSSHPFATEGDVAHRQSQFVAYVGTHGGTVRKKRGGKKKFFKPRLAVKDCGKIGLCHLGSETEGFFSD
jgi:hypothetical protein